MANSKPKKLAKVKTIKLGTKTEFEVVDQPTGQSAYVSEKPNTLTNFQMANKFGVYSFLSTIILLVKNSRI